MHRPFSLSVAVVLLTTGCHFTFDRKLEPGEIRGRLVFATSSGAKEAARGAVIALENSGITVSADARGNFVLRQLQQGNYALTIRDSETSRGLRLRNITLAPGANGLGDSRDLGELQLGAFGSISGTVESATPLQPGTVVTIPGFQKMDVVAGAFQSGDLVPGTYDLVLFAPMTGGAHVSEPVSVTVTSGPATVSPAFKLDEIATSTTGSVSGHAILTGAGSNKGLLITLTPSSPPISLETNDDSGLYTGTGLESGVYTVTASLNGVGVGVPFVVVGGSTTTDVPLIVVPGAGETIDAGPTDADAGDGSDGGADAGTTDGGGCGNTDTDVNNCGTCGRVCQSLGGRTPQCVFGACLTTLATGQTAALGLLVDDTSAYWYQSVANGSAIMSVSLAGGTPVTVNMFASGFTMAQDNANLYVGSVTDVRQYAKIGGPPVTIVSGQPFDSRNTMKVDGANVYWTNFGTAVRSATIADGTRTTLASDQAQTRGLALDAANVYWSDTTNGTIVKIPKTGGTAVTLATGQGALNLVVDGTSVYWANLTQGSIAKVSVEGGTVTTLATGQNQPEDLTTDGNDVYWGNFGDGTIFKVSVNGGTPKRVTAEQANPPCITSDATRLYWSTSSEIVSAEK